MFDGAAATLISAIHYLKIYLRYRILFLVAKLLYKSKCPSVCPYVNHV